ncbi:tetratricopeptide repeat protein [Sideroxydans lithotrophicus]|uniref:protein O-GlcNAc transferase n=1 Tax=Sideroxydans lithotrophicus (strain ES-1) TaxID=580332 RepID=D5CN16_SIDLE|nr:tetratricopeptide repeat protein [Sideroxydans lithotrophicus]ADE10852.1 TPR repeat-containing protein [Sideroxydans lithotrophicus ES-1]
MSAEIEQLLQRAVAHHRAGQFDDAEQLYRSIILIHPGHPEANHNIGSIALQKQQPAVAQMHFMKALEADPARAQYWLSYIEALFQTSQLEAAREVMAMARKNGLHGDDVDALETRVKGSAPTQAANSGKAKSDKPAKGHPQQNTSNPSQQQIDALVALFNQGRYQDVADSARAMTMQFPSHSFGWATLGVVLQHLGRNEEALQPMQRAVELAPKDAQAHSNLGNTLSYLGRLDEAETSFRRALKINKDFAEAHLNLGATLHDLGRFGEAEVSYRCAIQLKPGLAEAHYNLGNTLKSQGKLEEAVASYRKALQIAPGLVGASSNLGAALQAQGKLAEAETILRNVLQSNPDSLEAYSNLGSTLHDMGRLEEARSEYEKALRIKPDHAEILSNLGNTLMTMGLQEEAVRCFRDALEYKPDFLKARSNLLFSLNYSSSSSPEDCLAEACRYGEIVSSKAAAKFNRWPVAISPKRLRVGLVSADLRNHPVGYFLESVLAQLATSSVELFSYPAFHKSDELTARIKRHFSAWHPIHGMSDEAAARLIHDDKIHILIDLSGHTRLNRLPIFAWKPAPIQASWLGYFATTGVAEIDYVIGDPYVSPVGESAHFSESIWQLPECYWCFSAPDSKVEVSALPALQAGHITFGCFNNLSKMNDAVVALWAKILSAIPGAKLFLKYSQLNDPSVRDATLQRYAMHGIGKERLILEGSSPRAEYLASYHRVDIALDPFPYPGGTTSMESLWMGVPVLTRRGDRFLAHAGETIACNAGLDTWVATDEDDYLAKAVSFSSDLARLAKLRAGLRSQVLSSPIFDAPRFAGHFENAMWGMWKKWLAQREN